MGDANALTSDAIDLLSSKEFGVKGFCCSKIESTDRGNGREQRI